MIPAATAPAGQRHARAPAFVDERLRYAAADRETLDQAGGEIGSGQRREFLVGVQPSGAGQQNRLRFDYMRDFGS